MGESVDQLKEKYLDSISKKRSEEILSLEEHNLKVIQNAMSTTVENLLALRGHNLKAYNKVLTNWEAQSKNFLEVIQSLKIKEH